MKIKKRIPTGGSEEPLNRGLLSRLNDDGLKEIIKRGRFKGDPEEIRKALYAGVGLSLYSLYTDMGEHRIETISVSEITALFEFVISIYQERFDCSTQKG